MVRMPRKNGWATRPSGDRGAVAIVVAIFSILAMILLAFVVDRGRVYVTQSQLQNAVDSAALAGAQAFCGGGGDPTTIAVNYAAQNGVVVDPSRVVTQGGTMSYINVPASSTVDLLFGPFVNTETVAVAAQATAARSCLIDYRFVSDTDVVFAGNSSDLRETSIYAGECFYSTGTTNQFGVVAVGTTQADPLGLCHPRDPIDPGGGTVDTSIYGLKGTPSEYSVDQAADACLLPGCGATGTSVNDTYDGARGGTPFPGTTYFTDDCDSNSVTVPQAAGYTIYCTADFKKMDDDVKGIVVANGDIDLEAGTYSNVLIASIGGRVTLKTGAVLGLNTVVYAPGGVTDATGNSANVMSAIVFAGEIKFAGSGVNIPGGVEAFGPGDITLVQ